MTRSVVIVAARRTPIGKGHPERGDLRSVHPVDLGATVLEAVLTDAEVDPREVDMVHFGCVGQIGEQSTNISRQALLAADFPVSVPASTVDHQCGSSEFAIHMAAAFIAAGVHDIVIAGGVESMSRIPMGASFLHGPGTPFPPSVMAKYALTNQGLAAEMIAEEWHLTREACDDLACTSQERAAAADAQGAFEKEIVPVIVTEEESSRTISHDQGIRPGTTRETLAALKPAFREDGILHAGNSSQISDGAAALLLMSEEEARRRGMTPLARIASHVSVGVDPVTMLKGPIPATRQLLAQSKHHVDDIDLFEINEAFAPVVLAWQHELGADLAKVNVNGGAIALGHPLGASGARLMTTLVHSMIARNAHLGVQSMCCGGGLGIATLLER